MRKKRMHWLAEAVNKYHYKVGAEIGAATGLTTKHLLDNCVHLKKLFVADDWHPVVNPGHPSYYKGHPWSLDNMEQVFKQKVEGDPRIHILKGISWEMSQFVQDNSLDFIFIDASHDYESVLNDLNAWVPKVHKNGLVCGHDINIKQGVEKAVVKKFGRYSSANVDHVWFVKL